MIQQLKDVAVELGFCPDAEVAWVYFAQDEKYELHFKLAHECVILYNNELETYEVLDLTMANLTIEDHISKLKKFVNS